MTKNIVYHPDVIEFFWARIYLGVRSTYNVIRRGPMIYGQKMDFKNKRKT